MIKLFSVKKFLVECGIVGRLLRSYDGHERHESFFVVKLADSSLIQRYMIIIKTKIPNMTTSKENILRYEKSFEDCLEYLSYKCDLSKDDLMFIGEV